MTTQGLFLASIEKQKWISRKRIFSWVSIELIVCKFKGKRKADSVRHGYATLIIGMRFIDGEPIFIYLSSYGDDLGP